MNFDSDNPRSGMRRRIVGEKKRLNLKVEADLADWAFDYASRHHKTFTQLVCEHLVELRLREQHRQAQDADQI